MCSRLLLLPRRLPSLMNCDQGAEQRPVRQLLSIRNVIENASSNFDMYRALQPDGPQSQDRLITWSSSVQDLVQRIRSETQCSPQHYLDQIIAGSAGILGDAVDCSGPRTGQADGQTFRFPHFRCQFLPSPVPTGISTAAFTTLPCLRIDPGGAKRPTAMCSILRDGRINEMLNYLLPCGIMELMALLCLPGLKGQAWALAQSRSAVWSLRRRRDHILLRPRPRSYRAARRLPRKRFVGGLRPNGRMIGCAHRRRRGGCGGRAAQTRRRDEPRSSTLPVHPSPLRPPPCALPGARRLRSSPQVRCRNSRQRSLRHRFSSP
ncbi:hypothetical protein [Azospirillum largimobile]